MTELEDVLALDNSRRKKITRLAITCSASSHGAARPDQEVQVDFARPKPTSTGSTNIVAISVRSETAAWANRTFAEVEEQVERYWLDYNWPIGVLLGIIIVVLLLSTSQIIPSLSVLSYGRWLTDSDLDRIEVMLAKRPTLTDEDLREVSAMELRNMLEARKATRSAEQNSKRRRLLLLVPILAVTACIVILVTTCYPRAVFLWGDEVKRYESAVGRRKTIWGIIITVTVVGVAASFFSEAISSWLPR